MSRLKECKHEILVTAISSSLTLLGSVFVAFIVSHYSKTATIESTSLTVASNKEITTEQIKNQISIAAESNKSLIESTNMLVKSNAKIIQDGFKNQQKLIKIEKEEERKNKINEEKRLFHSNKIISLNYFKSDILLKIDTLVKSINILNSVKGIDLITADSREATNLKNKLSLDSQSGLLTSISKFSSTVIEEKLVNNYITYLPVEISVEVLAFYRSISFINYKTNILYEKKVFDKFFNKIEYGLNNKEITQDQKKLLVSFFKKILESVTYGMKYMSLQSIKQGYVLIQLINKEMGVNEDYIIQKVQSINTEIIGIEKSPPSLNDLNRSL